MSAEPVIPVSRLLLRSTGAATALQLWRMAILFATNLALRRWVDVSSWGLWSWAEALFLVIAALRDLGMSSQVVRQRPRPYGAFLAMQLAWGTALAALLALAAPLLALANAQADARTVPLLRALCLYLVLEGLATVPLVFFEAELAIGRTIFPELLRSTVFAGLALVLALRGAGVWSFVGAQLAATLLYTAALWWRAWGRIPLGRLRTSLRAAAQRPPDGGSFAAVLDSSAAAPEPSLSATLALVRGGLPIGAVWLLGLAVMYLDPLLLGGNFPQAAVGAYTFAYFLAFLPTRVLQAPVARALYPALVAYRGPEHRDFDAYRLATLFLVGVEVPAALLLFCNAEPVLRLLGGEQWGEAASYLRILAFAPLLDPLGRFGGELLITHHRERVRVLSLAASFVTMLGGGLLLIRPLGPAGMAWANLLPVGGLVVAWGVHRVAGAGIWKLLRDLLGVYLLPVPLFLVATLAAGDEPRLRLALSLAAALAALFLQWRRFGRAFVEFFRQGPAATTQ